MLANKKIYILVVVLFFGIIFGLKTPGVYTDYIYQTIYTSPQIQKINLSCDFFFYSQKNPCEILKKIPENLQENLTLSIIKKLDPEENQEWIRYWNSNLEMNAYENYNLSPLGSEGIYLENNSLKNAWLKILEIYPSVYKRDGGFYYVPEQAFLIRRSNVDFVINDSGYGPDICRQEYNIYGYKYKIKTKIDDYETEGLILPISNLLKEKRSANLTFIFFSEGKYEKNIYKKQNYIQCDEFNCTTLIICALNQTYLNYDTLDANFSIPIRYYENLLEYNNYLSVPKKGFASGLIKIKTQKDFLRYEIKIKQNSFVVSKNDLKIFKKGEAYPILALELIPSPYKSGDLNILKIEEAEDENYYYANISYRLYIDSPNISQKDCTFTIYTPFNKKVFENACESIRLIPTIKLEIINSTESEVEIAALVEDQLSNPLKNINVIFSKGNFSKSALTNENGLATIKIKKEEQNVLVSATIAGSEEYSQAKALIIIPGKGIDQKDQNQIMNIKEIFILAAVIFLIINLIIFLMKGDKSKRSKFGLFVLLLISLFNIGLAQDTTSAIDLSQTLEACKNYDFENAIRHFGECAEAYRAIAEFDSLRKTANIIISNIAPFVIITPNIETYKVAYANMVLIALALFRVAWAINSLYLILNIFNPKKRSEILAQYIWLGAFVIIVYVSYSLILNSINLINELSNWIVGTNASEILSKGLIEGEFVAENYQMLKLILPFLNLSYLILLARYVLVIGLFLFFPFSLLLFFNAPTRGFGKAMLSITFVVYMLGVLNSVLLLIYDLLIQNGDEFIQNAIASNFFTASFIIFFGFLDLFILISTLIASVQFVGGK
jgi:hypothetical protein